MSIGYCLCTPQIQAIHAPAGHYENEVARHWWGMVPGTRLPLSHGGSCQVLFAGYPGGATGPDVRDAVLSLPVAYDQACTTGEVMQQYTGDVEFHVRASDWFVHQHHTDARYNAVILHIVLFCDSTQSTLRQDGHKVPLCSLRDLAALRLALTLPLAVHDESVWACHRVRTHLPAAVLDRLLMHAGLLRFEQKVHMFVEQLHRAASFDEHDLYDVCLLPALAEGLGYGRDRSFFRATGLRLLGHATPVPEPLGRAVQPAPLDARRLTVLTQLVLRWRRPGVWLRLRKLLQPSPLPPRTILVVLRAAFCELGLSLARTDILICNVVLPFARAVALLEHDRLLAECAQVLYETHPGLSSNRITRLMSAQLLLPEEPRGSCRQQGLHYIYQQTCRDKRCDVCIMGKSDI